MKKLDKKEEQEFRSSGAFGRALMVGSNFVAGILVFGFLGHLIGKDTNNHDLFILIGSFLGICWGFYELYKIVIMVNKEDIGRDK